jgi:ABC-2 type transport system ATP-binding protein
MYALEIENLTKTFTGRRLKKQVAVNNLSLAIEPGEVFGFLGPNGAGKSTTIKSVMGLITPSSGKISIRGVPSTDPASRKAVGYLPENPAFYDYLTAREYLSFVGASFGLDRRTIAGETERVCALLDLAGSADRPMRTYSKGMVQRVGIAQAILHDPEVYILDEPMSGLDPLGRALVKDIIVDLKTRGKSVFFSTHITSDVEQVCDRVGIILNGELQTLERVSVILHEGITGYAVQTKDPRTGELSEAIVTRDEIAGFLALQAQQGRDVALIEPRRKSLEDFFLDIVASKKS